MLPAWFHYRLSQQELRQKMNEDFYTDMIESVCGLSNGIVRQVILAYHYHIKELELRLEALEKESRRKKIDKGLMKL